MATSAGSTRRTNANANSNGNGEGRSLDDVMRAPSTNIPDVVVLDVVDVQEKPKVFVDPQRDLWLSTVDGRHQSPIIPVRVGPHAETFYVHRDVLTKAEYFRRALDGQFKESQDQAIDLPEEDPAIFSFVVAFLYEDSYEPIKPVAKALVAGLEKGKGKELEDDGTQSVSDSETDSGSGSDDSARSRQRAEARRRRQQRIADAQNRKVPGRHRPECWCATCVMDIRGPPCWNCGVPRSRLVPPPRIWHQVHGRPPPQRGPPPPGPPPGRIRRRGARDHLNGEIVPEPRLADEDLKTWIMAYELSVDVYICAERYLMDSFKECIADCIVDNFETAGVQAAQPIILTCCKKLHIGVSNNDILLKRVFARVGFLLARLWKNFPEETHNFWMENPDVGGLIMKETMERREEDAGDDLPAMKRPISRSPPREEIIVRERW